MDSAKKESITELVAWLRDARFCRGQSCPRCGCPRVHRWGTFRARQRYRCTRCRRTFNDLTGSPAAYVKKLHLWPSYGRCLELGLTVRGAARRIGVHPSTAFRWRHGLLTPLVSCDDEHLRGWIELGSLRLPYSEKGKRRPRSASAGAGRWQDAARAERSARSVLVAVACDRLGHVVTGVNNENVSNVPRLDVRSIERMLAMRTDQPPTMTARQGRFGPVSRFVRGQGGRFHDARRRERGPGPLAHVETVNAYAVRFMRWLKRFRGVATRYLPNYLIWHRIVDRRFRHTVTRTVLRWPIVFQFP